MQVLQQGATEEKGENARLVRLLLRVLPREVAGLVDWHGSIETLYLLAPSQASPASSVPSTDARCSAAGSLCRRNGHCRHGEDHARPQGHGAGTSLVGLQGTELVAAVVACCRVSPFWRIVCARALKAGCVAGQNPAEHGAGARGGCDQRRRDHPQVAVCRQPGRKGACWCALCRLCRHAGVMWNCLHGPACPTRYCSCCLVALFTLLAHIYLVETSLDA